jgi:hypothetical protein
MISVLASSAVDLGLGPRSGQTKDCKIGICCFSAKHAALRRKSKHWLARNQDNVSEWSDMSTRGLLFQWASTIKIKLIIISLKINFFSPWYKLKKCWIGVKQQSLIHSLNKCLSLREYAVYITYKTNQQRLSEWVTDSSGYPKYPCKHRYIARDMSNTLF